MQVQPFRDVNRKLALIFKRIEKLDNEITEFVKKCQYVAVIETDAATGDRWFKVKISSDIPEEIFEDVAIAIYHLRSLLDQMTVSLGVICGLKETKHLYFPFEGTKENYFKTNGGRRKVKGLRPDLISIFDSFMPYKDEGDAEFYSLADLANVDKHKMILPLGSFGNMNFINGLAITKAKQPLILHTSPCRLYQSQVMSSRS